jgi:hypothetical protein
MKTVLSDLMHWLDEHPGPSFANLVDWQRLNISQMTSRAEADRSAKTRIEISAHISKMNNLSVRWHPGGWRHSDIDWGRAGQHLPNLITHRKWNQPTDFRWFVGDEQPTFDARPTNELMYVRGVGNLEPNPDIQYGPYAQYNHDVVDSVLVCAVRSAL